VSLIFLKDVKFYQFVQKLSFLLSMHFKLNPRTKNINKIFFTKKHQPLILLETKMIY